MINTTHSYKNPFLSGQEEGCSRSNTGLCRDCPMYVAMPYDVEDPVSGNIIQAGTVVQCVDIWQMMASWDAGRQTLRLHAGIDKAQNEANRRQEQIFGFVTGLRLQQMSEDEKEKPVYAIGQD